MNHHLFARIKPDPTLVFIYRSKFSLYIYTSCKLMYGSIGIRKEIFEFLIWRECEEGCVYQMAVVSILSQAEFGPNDQKTHPFTHSSHIKNSKISFRTPIEPYISLHDVYIQLWKKKRYKIIPCLQKQSKINVQVINCVWLMN